MPSGTIGQDWRLRSATNSVALSVARREFGPGSGSRRSSSRSSPIHRAISACHSGFDPKMTRTCSALISSLLSVHRTPRDPDVSRGESPHGGGHRTPNQSAGSRANAPRIACLRGADEAADRPPSVSGIAAAETAAARHEPAVLTQERLCDQPRCRVAARPPVSRVGSRDPLPRYVFRAVRRIRHC